MLKEMKFAQVYLVCGYTDMRRSIDGLAGYVHWLLTEEKNIGVGDASGMFPIDPSTGGYNKEMLEKFGRLTEGTAFTTYFPESFP